MRPNRRTVPLALRRLEDRLAPAIIDWTGGTNGFGTNWHDAGNWVVRGSNPAIHQVPTIADDAVVSAPPPGGPGTVVIPANAAARSLDCVRSFQFQGSVFSLGPGVSDFVGTFDLGTGTFDLADGAFLKGGTFTGTAGLTLPAGRTLHLFANAFNMAITNNGTVVADYINSNSGFTVSGPFTNGTGATLQIQSAARFNGGLVNRGAIELTSTVDNGGAGDETLLRVAGGNSVNTATGSITAVAGAGGRRNLELGAITFANQGLLRVAGGNLRVTAAALPGATLVTSGTVTIDPGQTLSHPGGFMTVTYAGGAVTGGTWDLTATPTVLNLAQSLSNASTNFLLFGGTTVNGPGTFTIAAGRTLTTPAATINAPLVNRGTLVVNGETSNLVVNGSFDNLPGATLRVLADANNNGVVRFATGFANAGTVLLDGGGSANTVEMFVNGGTFTNLPGGVVASLGGFGPHRFRNAQVANVPFANQGTLTLAGADLEFSSVSPTNTGTVDLGAGTLLGGDLANAAGGLVTGNGTVMGILQNAGTVSPGPAPGRLSFRNSIFGHAAGGTLVVELNGPAAGSEYDQIAVIGGVALAGTLAIAPTSTPAAGTVFTIIDNDQADEVNGNFAGLPQLGTVTVGGTTYRIDYYGGNGNDVTLTVLPPAAAPRVGGVAVNAGQSNAVQRSRVTSLTVTFSAPVTFAGAVADAFAVSRITGGAVGGFTAAASVINGLTVVTLSGFTGNETNFGSLADGRYRVLVRAGQVTANGQQLDGDGNGQGGDDYALDGTVANGLYRLFGDVNPDGVVNAADFAQFRGAFGSSTGQAAYLAFLDFDGDGSVNAFDFGQLRSRFGAGVP